jgi:hypothetical protein
MKKIARRIRIPVDVEVAVPSGDGTHPEDKSKRFAFVEFFRELLCGFSESAVSVENILTCGEILKKAKAADAALDLTEAEYAYVDKAVREAKPGRWNAYIMVQLISFIRAIQLAEVLEVEA